MRPITDEDKERIWDMHQAGVPVKRIARIMGRRNCSMRELIGRSGGIRPRARVVDERHLSLAEREEISRGLAAGRSMRSIADALGRARRRPSVAKSTPMAGGSAIGPSPPSGRQDGGPGGPRWPSSPGAGVCGPKWRPS